MLNIAVFCSGEGTNLQAIIEAVQRGDIKARLSLVVSDNKEAPALQRAKKAAVKTIFLDPQEFPSREKFEKELIAYLQEENIGLIVLAGFMRVLSPFFVQKYPNKIFNIHPSLLPAFKGSTNAVRDALNYGVKFSGATVHFVDEKIDNGPIVLQGVVEIEEDDNEESLRQKIHHQEHIIYPLAIKLFAEGRLKVKGRKVRINKEKG